MCVQVLALCAERQLAVVPQGGNSSLSGGAVPVASEVVLSTDRMTAIRSFDEVLPTRRHRALPLRPSTPSGSLLLK